MPLNATLFRRAPAALLWLAVAPGLAAGSGAVEGGADSPAPKADAVDDTSEEARAKRAHAWDTYQYERCLKEAETWLQEGKWQGAQKLLERARKYRKQGMPVSSREKEIEAGIAAASKPLVVTFRSDGRTSVSVLSRVSPMWPERFSEMKYKFPPGSYIAKGTRAGFYDEDVPFVVVADEPPPVVTVVCSRRRP